jgi:hypothetical protein
MATKTRRLFRPTDDAGVRRQEMMARAMQEQASMGAPADWERMPVVPKYGLGNALAQMGQAMTGAYLQKEANEGAKDIDAAKRKKLADAMGIDSMTKGFDEPDDGVGPVRDPNKRQEAESRAQAMRQFNELVPVDQQTELMGSMAFAKAFPAPKKKFSGTVGKDEVAYLEGEEVARGTKSATPDTRTDDQREYEFSVSQGDKRTFAEYMRDMKRAGSSSTTVNLDTAKPPEGYIRERLPNGDTRLVKEAGGPPEQKARQAFSGGMMNLQRTFDAVDRLEKGNIEGITGWQGIFPNMPGGDAANAEVDRETLLAQMGFKELADMRAASPTGGALGSITERELTLLQNAAIALQKAQSPEQFRARLGELKQQLQNSAAALHAAYQQDFGSAYQPGGGAGAGNNQPQPPPTTQRPQIGPNSAPPGPGAQAPLAVKARASSYLDRVRAGGR